MAYYDPNKQYGKGGFGDFMDSNASKMGEMKSAQQADLDTVVQNLSIEMQEKAGAIDAEQAAEARQKAAEQVESDYNENMSRVRSLSLTNTLINTTGILLSAATVAGTGSSATNAATKLAAKGTMGAAVKTAWQGASGISKLGAVTKAVVKTAPRSLAGTALSGLGHVKGFARAGISAAPFAVAKLYTTSRTNAESARFDETINSLQSTYDYLSSEDETLTETIKADTAEWRKGYEEGSQALLDAYNSGEMTQEQYNQAYEAFVQEQDQKWAEVRKTHAETAEYVTQHGAAYATDEYIADHGYDPDLVNSRCETIAKLNADNPDAYDAAKTRFETQQQLDTGSTFTNFLANMNATLLHYVPGLAYVEAAALKAADVVADFAANHIPVLSSILPYEEKYKGTGISEIASSICEDAEARYELAHSSDGAAKVLADGADSSVQEAVEAANPDPEPSPA